MSGEGVSFGTTPAVDMPDFERKPGEGDADFMARVQKEGVEFQLQMIAYNGVDKSTSDALDTVDKTIDR